MPPTRLTRSGTPISDLRLNHFFNEDGSVDPRKSKAFVSLLNNWAEEVVNGISFAAARGVTAAHTLRNNLTVEEIASGFTAGSIIFASAGGALDQDNDGLFFDATNVRMGIGENVPAVRLSLAGTGASNGISFGDDAADPANLYRSAANELTTDDALISGTSVQAPFFRSAAADVADTGAVRLGNGASQGIFFEKSPTGTDFGVWSNLTTLVFGETGRTDLVFNADINDDLTLRFGQQVSGAEDPLGFFDFLVHDDVSVSTSNAEPNSSRHQFAFRGTKIVEDTDTGIYGGIHGVGCRGTDGAVSGNNVDLFGVQGEIEWDSSSTGTGNEAIAFGSILNVGASGGPAPGVLDKMVAFSHNEAFVFSYTVQDLIAFWGRAMTTNSAVDSIYGVKIEDVSGAATNNYAIKTGTGLVDFGDDVNVTGTLDATTLTESGNAVPNATDHLGFFAATTSAQLAGVLSDETGSGLAVFNNTPTLLTPTIADFTNAQHDHSNAAGGGSIAASGISGQVSPAQGGTGDDTSATTGVPRITAGNWTYDAGISHLAASTSAELAGVISDETGSSGGVLVFNNAPSITSPTIGTSATFSFLTEGSVPFAGTGGLLSQDNTNLFWDAGDVQLFVGGATDISGRLQAKNDSASVIVAERSSSAASPATGFVGSFVGYNPDTTDGNGLSYNFASDTTGAGAATGTTFGQIGFQFTTHDHATRTGAFYFRAANSAAFPSNLILSSTAIFGTAVDVLSTGVRLTGSNGTLTFLGLGDGADEDLTLDLNTTANTGIFTSSTSLNKLTFTGITLNTSSGFEVGGAALNFSHLAGTATAAQLPIIVDTADQGYFLGVQVFPASSSATTASVTAIDQTRVYQFVLPFRVTVGNIVSRVTTGGGAGKLYGIGLYNAAGSLVLETGALDANTVAISKTAITPVTLDPGPYFFAWTSDSTSTALSAFSVTVGGAADAILNAGAVEKVGTAAASSAGVLPASMGTVTALSITAIPLVSFER